MEVDELLPLVRSLKGEVEAPIAAGTVLGEVTLSLGGEVYGTVQLVAGSSVELSKAQYMKNQIAGVLGMTWVKVVIIALVLALICYIALVIRYRVLHRRHMREVRRAKLERQRRMERSRNRLHSKTDHALHRSSEQHQNRRLPSDEVRRLPQKCVQTQKESDGG